MKKTETALGLLAIVLAWVLAACSTGDGDSSYNTVDMQADKSGMQQAAFYGEWTVNKQVVDTARLEVRGTTLSVRLPEYYLTGLCFTESGQRIETKGQPTVLQAVAQGYSDNANYLTTSAGVRNSGDTTLYLQGSIFATVDGAHYRIDLLADESGSSVYRTDTGRWTVGIIVSRLLLVNLDDQTESERRLPTKVYLYYNAKSRI